MAECIRRKSGANEAIKLRVSRNFELFHPGSFLLWLITMLAAVLTRYCVLGFIGDLHSDQGCAASDPVIIRMDV